ACHLLKAPGPCTPQRGLSPPPHLPRPTPDELDAAPGDFPELAPVSSLVKLMVELDGRWDRLTLARRAGWKVPENHPDVDPPHEAVQLWELYREAARLLQVKTQPESFRRWLT